MRWEMLRVPAALREKSEEVAGKLKYVSRCLVEAAQQLALEIGLALGWDRGGEILCTH